MSQPALVKPFGTGGIVRTSITILLPKATQKRILQELDAARATGFPLSAILTNVIAGYRPELYAKALKS
ncbi:MAG: hypothetical protein ACLQFM_18130 [Terriglobales bacterium]|jgi:hypothetical protein